MNIATYVKRKELPRWISKKEWRDINYKIHREQKEYDHVIVESEKVIFIKNELERKDRNNPIFMEKEYYMIIKKIDIIEWTRHDESMIQEKLKLGIDEVFKSKYLKYSKDERAIKELEYKEKIKTY